MANSEIAALVAATTDDARLIVVGLLMGMTIQELVALDWEKIDLSAGAIRFGDGSARIIPVDEPLRGLLGLGKYNIQTAPAPYFMAQTAEL